MWPPSVCAHLWGGLLPPNLIGAPACRHLRADGLIALQLFVGAHAAVVQALDIAPDLAILLQEGLPQGLIAVECMVVVGHSDAWQLLAGVARHASVVGGGKRYHIR